MTSAASQRRSADLRARELETVIREIGTHLPLRRIAAELSARGIEAHRGGEWHAASVRRVMMRCGMPVGIAIDVRCATVPIEDQIDCVITSPPYAMQRAKQYGGISDAAYPAFTVSWMAALIPRLSPSGSVAIVCSPHISNGVLADYWLHTRLALRAAGWFEIAEMPWIKSSSAPLGHNARPRRSWESVLWYSRTAKPFCDPYHEQRTSSRIGYVGRKGRGAWVHSSDDVVREGMARCRDVISVGVGANDRANDHPAAFPVALAEWLIGLLSKPGGTVCDPFVGSGTVAVAAERMGRRFVGGDISSRYVEQARVRLRMMIAP